MVMSLDKVHIDESSDQPPTYDSIAENNNNTNNTNMALRDDNSDPMESQVLIPKDYIDVKTMKPLNTDCLSSESDHNEFSSESIGEYQLSSGDKQFDTDCSTGNSSSSRDHKQMKEDRNRHIANSNAG